MNNVYPETPAGGRAIENKNTAGLEVLGPGLA